MSIRTLITAICIAAFAAGPGALQARASVQPSFEREGYASVGASVDGVSAQTPLSGSFYWWASLFNYEATALTNARIHVVLPTGTVPPDTTADSVAPNGNLQGYLPSAPGVVIPEFDSTRAVSPGVADPGTHRQTVTVTLTPQQMPLGYTESWATVWIDGLSTASNSAIVSKPTSASSRDEGTGQVTVWFAALPQTKYTIEVTFDVANGSSTSVPYKPHVTITETFAANLDITQAQPSYSFSDPDLGAATWSVDQSVVWAPRVYRMTEVAYAPVPVVSSVYTYIDNYNQMAEPANVDSVSADSTLSGKLTWYAAMCSETDSPLPTPSISVDQSSQTFTPPLSFPLATAPQSTLAGGGCFNLNKLDGGSNGSVVDKVATTSGFDLSRTMSPATIAAGGATQTVHVSLTPRASGNEEVWLEVMTGYVPGATVDSSSVVWPTLGSGEQFGYTNVGANSAAVTIENPVVGKTYTLTVGIQVANATSAARTFKPDVSGGAGFHVNVDAGGAPADGPSTTVHDDLLGGTFTFSFGTPIHWTHNLFREKTVDLAGQWTGGPEANVGVIRYTDVMTDASTDSVVAAQTLPAILSWTAYLSNAGSEVLPAPKISVDGSSDKLVPTVTFPLSITGADLKQYDSLYLFDFDNTGHQGHVANTHAATGFDVTRTMSPTAIPAGGGTQTMTLSVTLRDPSEAGDWIHLSISPGGLVPGATIDPNSVVLPTTDPNANTYADIPADGSYVYWYLSAGTLNTTYSLTLQIHVPNGATTALRYKPSAMVDVSTGTTSLPAEGGTSTAITDDVLPATFTFSGGTDILWDRRTVSTGTAVNLAPLAAAVPPDTTAPVLNVPADKVVEATGATGAVVSFTVSATDDVDPSPTVACTPASGSVFPLGSTTVNCTATDTAGNKATGSFAVKVEDTTAPVISAPADKTVDATSSAGAAVSYTVTASDSVDANPTVACTPASGSMFPVGATTVNCTATDAAETRRPGHSRSRSQPHHRVAAAGVAVAAVRRRRRERCRRSAIGGVGGAGAGGGR